MYFLASPYGMTTSKTLFWISCFPSMIILSWIHSSIRQPGGAHCNTHTHTHTHTHRVVTHSAQVDSEPVAGGRHGDPPLTSSMR